MCLFCLEESVKVGEVSCWRVSELEPGRPQMLSFAQTSRYKHSQSP